MKTYFRSRFFSPILKFLRQGMTVEKMSLTLALGICFGIMPFLGVTTYLLALLAIIFRLNIPAIQFVNYAVYAFQLVLYVPFLKLSKMIFYPGENSFSFKNIIGQYQADFIGTLKDFWYLNLGAIIIWAAIALPLGLFIYHFSQPYLRKQKMRLISVSSQ